MKNNIERNFDRIDYLSLKSQTVQPQNTLSADVQAAAKSSRSNASERIKQLRSQIDALNCEYNEAKGIRGIFKHKRIQKQLDQLFDELRQIEES